MPVKEFVCLEPGCGKRCTFKNHQKSHKKPPVQSTSLFRFLKKKAPKKMAVELKSTERKPRQIKLSMRPRPSASIAAVSSASNAAENLVVPKRPRIPRKHEFKQRSSDPIPFLAPPEITLPSLKKKSPEFRVALVRFYNGLKEKSPMLDKNMYHEVNEKSLGVKLRAFQSPRTNCKTDAIQHSKTI